MIPNLAVVPVSKVQYLATHLHLRQCWAEGRAQELEWFVQSMRGDLPVPKKAVKNYVVHHVFIPDPARYLAALAAISTRPGLRIGTK